MGLLILKFGSGPFLLLSLHAHLVTCCLIQTAKHSALHTQVYVCARVCLCIFLYLYVKPALV